MRSHHVHYQLEHGFIHNWLVAGPQTIPVDLDSFHGDNFRQQIIQKYYEAASGIAKTPVERGPLTKGIFQIGDYTGTWNYFACRDDHQIDHTEVYINPQYVRSWAYTQIASKTAVDVLLVLSTYGPADVWLNGQHVHRQNLFYSQQPGKEPIKVNLLEGMNKLLVRFEDVGYRNYPHAMAMQVCNISGEKPIERYEPYPSDTGLHVSIPTLIQGTPRRNSFERVYSSTYIKQDVFQNEEPINLFWPDGIEEPSPAVVRLMTGKGTIYAEATVDGTAGDKLFLSYPSQIPEGPYRILMMPLAWEYYDRDLRITRELHLWSLGLNRYASTPYGTIEKRRQESLASASQRAGLFAEIAKMALNNWADLKTEVIIQAAQNASCLELMGILGMLYRLSDQEKFPKELIQPVESCIKSYRYGAKSKTVLRESVSEGQKILSYACEILAGQRYPKLKFTVDGNTGKWHRENGEHLAIEWLQERNTTGFTDWDSGSSFADALTALSHLVDLAETEQVWEMASVLMDKLFFTLALNSFQGTLVSTRGSACALDIKGGLLDPMSGINRMMWGTGIFNHHISGPVSLGCMEKYELPTIISSIANSSAEELWDLERHAVNAGRSVNKVTYKTPDTMLCSAQDYYPGEKGCQEHIWQASLGVSAVVFVTHPACSSENDARQPNFWAGNAILPRVAQWKDALIAVYQLPDDDWMGFTHAYFPTYAFDEYNLREGWAFARKGNGYLALTSAHGFSLAQNGQYAYRELRSPGLHNIWLCQMGRAALDGDFTAFQDNILACALTFKDLSVRYTSLRGEKLSFGWNDPFLRDKVEQPLSGFLHYENPYTRAEYPCTQMEIQVGEDLMRLDFRSSTG